jgi:hypothetical protein
MNSFHLQGLIKRLRVLGIQYSVFGIRCLASRPLTAYRLPITPYPLTTTVYQPPLTNYHLPLTPRPQCLMPKSFVLICTLLLSSLITTLNAQDTQGEIEKVEIVIEKNRQIVLPKADRNFEKVPPRPVEPIKPEITYDFKDVAFVTPDYNPAIRPLKLKTEPISKIFGNYISAGYGNYASPYLEGYATTKRDKNKFYGVKLFHHSFGNGPVDSGNSASGSTEIKVFGRTFSRSIVAVGFLSFENRNAKFYGELPGIFKGDASSQSYSYYSLGGDVGNSNTSDFNYNLKAGFSYLKDNINSSENEVNLNFASTYKIDDKKKLIINADYFLMSRKYAQEGARARHIFRVKPSYQFSPIDNLSLSVGVTAAFQNDTLGTVKSVNLYPNVTASYELTSTLQVYSSLTGDIDKVSLHSLSRENLWLEQNVLLNHTNRTFEFSGGLKGKLAGKFAFNTGISFANLKNLYFYQNQVFVGFNTNKHPEKFDVVYDQGNTSRTNLFAEVGYSSAQSVRLLLRGDFFGYSTDKIAEAWHKPTFRLAFNSSYNIYNKILLDVDLIAQGGMKALALGNFDAGFGYGLSKVTTIGSALDLNLKASYLVSNQFSVFVKCSNVLNNQYQMYLYYPVRGFQAMAGLTWSF